MFYFERWVLNINVWIWIQDLQERQSFSHSSWPLDQDARTPVYKHQSTWQNHEDKGLLHHLCHTTFVLFALCSNHKKRVNFSLLHYPFTNGATELKINPFLGNQICQTTAIKMSSMPPSCLLKLWSRSWSNENQCTLLIPHKLQDHHLPRIFI